MHPSRKRSGFTLIELLTVIAIIAILMGLLLPALNAAKNAARKSQAKNDLTQFCTAVKAFYTDYGVYPCNTAVTSTNDVEYGNKGGSPHYNNSDLVNVLRADSTDAGPNQNNAINTRQQIYLDVPLVKDVTNPKSGLGTGTETNNYGVSVAGEWYDPWGAPYMMCVNGSYSGYVNVYTLNYSDVNYTMYPSGSQNKTIETGCIGASFGADHAIGSAGNGAYIGSDDVLSWQ